MPEAVATPRREHLAFLGRMVAEEVVPPAVAALARDVWLLALASAGKSLPVPAAAAFEGGPIKFNWLAGPHHLAVTIADGSCRWMYRNPTGEFFRVAIGPNDALPTMVIRALDRIAGADLTTDFAIPAMPSAYSPA